MTKCNEFFMKFITGLIVRTHLSQNLHSFHLQCCRDNLVSHFLYMTAFRMITKHRVSLCIPACLAEQSTRFVATEFQLSRMCRVTGLKITKIHWLLNQDKKQKLYNKNLLILIQKLQKLRKMSEKSKEIQNNSPANDEKEQQANQITKQQLRELKMMFDYFDTDKSGSLDTEELKKLVVMIMGSQGSQEERLDLLAQVDQDGNGSVQYHQFQQLFKKKLMKTNFRKQMQAAFKLIDISESSYITYQQLYLICNQLNMNFQPSEIKRMIEIGSQADPGPNGQKEKGKVFLEQFIQMMSEN